MQRDETTAMVQATMILDTIKSVDFAVNQGWRPRDDGAIDKWSSHVEEVKAGARWYGDCDDKTRTFLQLIIEAGADLKDLYRTVVDAGTPGELHVMATVRDTFGAFWCAADTLRS